MEDERDDSTVSAEDAPRDGDAAHRSAVMTVRLTLLLLIIGVALLVSAGPGVALP